MQTRVFAIAVGYAALLASGFGAAGCASVTDPPLPGGAAAFAPPAVYARWWAQAEVCSGRTGDLAAVRWFVVPGADTIPLAGQGEVNGYWSAGSNEIVLAEHSVRDGGVVRHEMLHALLRGGGHPPAEFQGRCAGYVTCYGVCADAGAPYPPPPAGAPVLAPTDLQLTVEATPAAVARVPGDSGVTVVVRATNPRGVPVWVQLVPPPGCGLRCPDFTGFGGGIGFSDFAGVVSQGEIRLTTAGRIALPAGGSAVAVFDFDLDGYRPGTYLALGSFNVAGLSRYGDPGVTAAFEIER